MNEDSIRPEIHTRCEFAIKQYIELNIKYANDYYYARQKKVKLELVITSKLSRKIAQAYRIWVYYATEFNKRMKEINLSQKSQKEK